MKLYMIWLPESETFLLRSTGVPFVWTVEATAIYAQKRCKETAYAVYMDITPPIFLDQAEPPSSCLH